MIANIYKYLVGLRGGKIFGSDTKVKSFFFLFTIRNLLSSARSIVKEHPFFGRKNLRSSIRCYGSNSNNSLFLWP